jgi:hypothetical protein
MAQSKLFDTRERFARRVSEISNATANGYTTGDRVQHCQTIQIANIETWNSLFERECIKPEVERYAKECIHWTPESGAAFLGHLRVSLMMQEHDARPGVYTAVFIIGVYPHQHQPFCTGHIVETEFQKDSFMHQTVTRLFYDDDQTSFAAGEYFTERSLLMHLADDNEMRAMLFGYFMDEDFYSERRSGNEFEHACMRVWECMRAWECVVDSTVAEPEHELEDEADEGEEEDEEEEEAVSIPPPPPINDFGAVFRSYYDTYDTYQDDEDNLNNLNNGHTQRRRIVYTPEELEILAAGKRAESEHLEAVACSDYCRTLSTKGKIEAAEALRSQKEWEALSPEEQDALWLQNANSSDDEKWSDYDE